MDVGSSVLVIVSGEVVDVGSSVLVSGEMVDVVGSSVLVPGEMLDVGLSVLVLGELVDVVGISVPMSLGRSVKLSQPSQQEQTTLSQSTAA